MQVRIVILLFLHSSAILGVHHLHFPPSFDTFQGLCASFRRLHTHKSEWIPLMHAPYIQPKTEVASRILKVKEQSNEVIDSQETKSKTWIKPEKIKENLL